MTIDVVSTTDTPANVKAAIGGREAPKGDPKPEQPDKSAPAPEKGAGQKAASDSEPEETDQEGEDDSEDDDSEKAAADKDASQKDKPKSKGGWQRRIDKKTAENSDLKRQLAAREQELERLRSLAAPKGNASGTETKAADASKEPNPDDFTTHADFVKALTKWEVAESRKAERAEADKAKVLTERQQVVKAYEEREKAFAKEHDDYQEVLDGVTDIQASPAMIEAIVTSEVGPALAYDLASNREEFERISKLSPGAAAREMGKIEARLTSQGSEGKKPEPKTTKAPKPLDPVGGKGASVDKDIYNAANLTQKEYEAIRAKQRASQASA